MKPSTTEKELCLNDVPVTVEYTAYRACRGARECGLQLEPDEPAHVEVENVIWKTKDIHGNTVEIDVTDYVNTDNLADEIYNDLSERDE